MDETAIRYPRSPFLHGAALQSYLALHCCIISQSITQDTFGNTSISSEENALVRGTKRIEARLDLPSVPASRCFCTPSSCVDNKHHKQVSPTYCRLQRLANPHGSRTWRCWNGQYFPGSSFYNSFLFHCMRRDPEEG